MIFEIKSKERKFWEFAPGVTAAKSFRLLALLKHWAHIAGKESTVEPQNEWAAADSVSMAVSETPHLHLVSK